MKWLPALCVGGFAVAAVSQANVQVFSRSSILDRGESSGRFVQTKIDLARRGGIYSIDGKPLAQQAEAATLGVTFKKVPQVAGFYVALSEASGIPASEFEFLAGQGITYREWRRTLTPDQVNRLAKVRQDWRADGLSISRGGAREYPLGSAAASIVGFLQDGEPRAGLESSLDKSLRGEDGKTVGMVDRQGAFLPMRLDGRTEKRQDGEAVVLTLDSVLQSQAATVIARAVREHRAKSGVAIIMDPKTGAILAMANAPSFDPLNPTAEVGEKTSIGFNPATMAAWEPGSTFKLLTLARALETGKVTMGEHVNCGGSLQVWSNRVIRCDAHGGKRAHGSIDPTKAIAKSCNVSAALWARDIGHPDMVKYLDNIGLTERTTLGLPLEARGQFVRDEYAKGLQLATFGFGQSMTATPVALASAFSMLANGGVRMKPRLIESIGGVKKPVEKGVPILRPETCQDVLHAMEAVIETDAGTGKHLRIPGYRLGGKTGTAQKINPDTGTVEGGGYVANFVGYVPAQNPRVVILVMVDDPKGQYYGGTVAGPVFNELAKASIRRLAIPRTDEEKPVLPIAKPKPSVAVQAKPLGEAGRR